MAEFKLQQKRELKPALRVKLGARLKMAQILEISEEEFAQKVREVETNPLFNELLVWGGIKRKRFPGVSPAFFRKVSLNEENTSYRQAAGPVFSDEGLTALIERMGRDNFTDFFLVPERIYTVKQISDQTGLNKEEIEKVADFVNNFSADRLSSGTPAPHSEGTRLIAAIRHEREDLLIEDFNFDLCRGRYLVDESGLRQFKASLPPGRKRSLNRIIAQLQWINGRRNIIHSILQSLLNKQRRFLISGRPEDLKNLTQRQLSLELGVSPSLLNRAIKKRALKLPDGSITVLKNFFPGRREEIKTAIKKILKAKKGGNVSDSQIKTLLCNDYGLTISRRTVNFYRNRLNKV